MTNGGSFRGSIDGQNYYCTHTITDSYGRKDSCYFGFKVFYCACTEPSSSATRRKRECTHNMLYGSECTFECIDGYRIPIGAPVKATCEKGESNLMNWTTLPECEQKSCPAPFAPANGYVSCRSQTYEFDTECYVSCNKGYRLEGSSVIICQSDEKWSNTTKAARCIDDEPPVITCTNHVVYAVRGTSYAPLDWTDPLVTDNVDHSLKAVKLSGFNKGDVVKEGIYIIQYRVTDTAGNYHPLLSECRVTVEVKLVSCPPLLPPTNGAMTYDSINSRPLYVMLCQSGFDIPVVGRSFTGRLSCQDSGKWYPLDKFPDCKRPTWGDMVLLAELIYKGNCADEKIKADIKEAVLKYLSTIADDIERSICPGRNCKF
ncbi:P-selectin-like [Dreissena polymorpha]|nr:P-selectin-like [Dreissena polymorpha]